jgi:GTP-dependent phosphoenolpyruvate carboxykinase
MLKSNLNVPARVEHPTFICTRHPPGNSMFGRTMYVIPFPMGPLSIPRNAWQDPVYVGVNMRIVTRITQPSQPQ